MFEDVFTVTVDGVEVTGRYDRWLAGWWLYKGEEVIGSIWYPAWNWEALDTRGNFLRGGYGTKEEAIRYIVNKSSVVEPTAYGFRY